MTLTLVYHPSTLFKVPAKGLLQTPHKGKQNPKTNFCVHSIILQNIPTTPLEFLFLNSFIYFIFLKITKQLSPGEQGKKPNPEIFPSNFVPYKHKAKLHISFTCMYKNILSKTSFTHNMCISLRTEHIIRLASLTLPNLIFLFSF